MTVAENLSALAADIFKTCRDLDRPSGAVELIAVSKMQSDDRIDAALAYGQRAYGENRVQDAMERWTKRRELFPDLRLHLIGPLQTNKVKDALALFDVIETVDRDSLVAELGKELKKTSRQIRFFIQVNTGEEPQKHGVSPGNLPALLETCKDHDVPISGLMCIPPVDEPAGVHFALLAKLATRAGLDNLSMGMSADYKIAIAAGSTPVRIGSAIFGERG